jgi:hypothetical protein
MEALRRPIIPGDRGPIAAKFSVDAAQRRCFLDMGVVAEYGLLSPSQARISAASFRHGVAQAFGALDYRAEELEQVGFRIEPLLAAGVVQLVFPCLLMVLAANPEVFLALADRLEAAAILVERPAA